MPGTALRREPAARERHRDLPLKISLQKTAGNWEVTLPAEEVPPELPEPALGINFARDGMQVRLAEPARRGPMPRCLADDSAALAAKRLAVAGGGAFGRLADGCCFLLWGEVRQERKVIPVSPPPRHRSGGRFAEARPLTLAAALPQGEAIQENKRKQHRLQDARVRGELEGRRKEEGAESRIFCAPPPAVALGPADATSPPRRRRGARGTSGGTATRTRRVAAPFLPPEGDWRRWPPGLAPPAGSRAPRSQRVL